MPIVKNPDAQQGSAIISDKVKDRSNDPYFLKKAAYAKEFLRKRPLPDHLRNK